MDRWGRKVHLQGLALATVAWAIALLWVIAFL